MANYQNQRNQGQGGQGSNNNQKQNQRGRNNQPKMDLRVRHDVRTSTTTYNLVVKVSAYSSGQPVTGQEVVLEQGVVPINNDILDINGDGQFSLTGHLTNQEQTLDFRVCLSGTAYEKSFSVRIPAKAPATKKDLRITVDSRVDANAGICQVGIAVAALSDGNPFPGQRISLMRGAAPIGIEQTDGNGFVNFLIDEQMTQAEKSVKFRIYLLDYGYYEDVVIVVPALPAKKEKDAEYLILMSYNDNSCFRVKARVLGERGKGMANKPVAFWLRGVDTQLTTNSEGEVVFPAGTIAAGEKETLTATVSGIEDRAKVVLKNSPRRNRAKAFSRRWWLGENNGRAFIGLCLAVVMWVIAFLMGPGNQAMINPDIFRGESRIEGHRVDGYYEELTLLYDAQYANKVARSGGSSEFMAQAGSSSINKAQLRKESRQLKKQIKSIKSSIEKEDQTTYLSGAERSYNSHVARVGTQHLIEPSDGTRHGKIKFWIFSLLFTLTALMYFIWSARDEFEDAYRSVTESMFDQSYAKVGDPAFERFTRFVGNYGVARKNKTAVVQPTVVTSDDAAAAATAAAATTAATQPAAGGTASGREYTFGNMFTADLVSEGIVRILFETMGRVFKR